MVDAFLLARLVQELDDLWRGVWVQQAWQDESGRLILKVYSPSRTGYLLLSPLPEAQGLGFLSRRPPCPPRPPAFAAYLRAHLVGGSLEAAHCPPFERIADLRFRTRAGPLRLVLEATGRKGNLLAVDAEGSVRAAWRRLPHPSAYTFPRKPEGLELPSAVSAEQLEVWAASGEPLHRRVLGLSPDLSREISHRASTEGLWPAFFRLVGDYGSSGTVPEYADGLSAVPLTHLGPPQAEHAEALPPAGEWLEQALEKAAAAKAETVRQAAGRARRQKLERRVEKIREDLSRLPDPDGIRRLAEALGASLGRAVKGSTAVEVPDPRGAGVLVVALDPTLTPGQNLDRLYDRARRAVRTREALEARLATSLAEFQGEPPAAPTGATARESGRPASGLPFRRYRSSDGWPIWVGRNGKENDRLLREARPWDLWLHAREAQGAHVLVRLPGKEAKVPQRTLLEAAGLAALHSRRAGEGTVEVMAVEAGRVRKPKGASPGRVILSGERTIRVQPGAGNAKEL